MNKLPNFEERMIDTLKRLSSEKTEYTNCDGVMSHSNWEWKVCYYCGLKKKISTGKIACGGCEVRIRHILLHEEQEKLASSLLLQREIIPSQRIGVDIYKIG